MRGFCTWEKADKARALSQLKNVTVLDVSLTDDTSVKMMANLESK
jgi:hypothetical protein